MRYSTGLLIFLCSCFCLTGMVYGKQEATTKRIIISNFDMSSAGKYSYLGNGVRNMLLSRLSSVPGVNTSDHILSNDEMGELTTNKDGGQTSTKLKADYLLTGALFALTKGLNIQVELYPLSSGGEVERFSIVAKDDSEIFPQINKLSQSIGESVFAGEKIEGLKAGEKGFQQSGDAAFVTVHPEAAYKKGLYSGSVIDVDGSAIAVTTEGVRRTLDVSFVISAMAVGDIDGDGKTEFVILSERKLRVFRANNKSIKELGVTKLPADLDVHAVNVADLNADGKMEIYLSATRNLNVASLAIEWTESGGFVRLIRNIPWYIRPIKHPIKGMILAGQKRGDDLAKMIEKGIYHLTPITDNKIEVIEKIVLPDSVNVFSFVYADVDGDGSYEKIVLDRNQKLRVYDSSNGLLWVSSDNYGGSKTYIGPSYGGSEERGDKTGSKTHFSEDENMERDLVFIPGRVVVADLDHDGQQDVVVGKNLFSSNFLSTFRLFRNMRMFDGGSIVGLSWKDSGLVETWKTGNHSGFIPDFGFFMDGSEGEEKQDTFRADLYLAQVPKSGTLQSFLPGFSNSKISMYNLKFSKRNQDVEPQ